MKKILPLFVFAFTIASCFGYEIYDAGWCRKNGGKIEFDYEYNINFNCITYDIKNIPYPKKVYNIICRPFLSSILNNEEPQFLKIVGNQECTENTIFDRYNWKITEDELIRYI